MLNNLKKEFKPLLIGEFLHNVFWAGGPEDILIEADIDGDINKEEIRLGIVSQFGFKLDVYIGKNRYRLSDDLAKTKFYNDIIGDFYCQLAIKDITKDGLPEILLAIGNSSSELYLNIWQFDKQKYLNTSRIRNVNPFNFLGQIVGQERMFIFPSGRIDVPFGSQGLFTTYMWNGKNLQEIENNEEMEKNISNLEAVSFQKKSMECFLIGTKICNKDIEEKNNGVFIAYDYRNKETESIIIEKGINPVFKDFGLEPIIAKEFKVNYDFMCKICKLIQESKYFLADISDFNNFNVGFELGIAVGIGKDTIIIANENSMEASDLKRTEAIKYNYRDIKKFKSDLSKMLKNIFSSK